MCRHLGRQAGQLDRLSTHRDTQFRNPVRHLHPDRILRHPNRHLRHTIKRSIQRGRLSRHPDKQSGQIDINQTSTESQNIQLEDLDRPTSGLQIKTDSLNH